MAKELGTGRWRPSSTGDPADPPLGNGLGRLAGGPVPGLVFAARVGVYGGIAVLAVLPVLAHTASWPARVAGLGYAAGLVAVLLTCLGRLPAPRYVGPALVLQAALGYLPVLQFGAAWSVFSGFFAGGLLLVVRPPVAVPAAALVVAVAGALTGFAGAAGPSATAGLLGAVFTAVTALAVFGLTWSARLAAERTETRRELTRRAVAEERRRFSRDAHDLLGLSLSAITLKGELTNRLIADQPERAMEELAEILDMSRKALADVRSVAAGYRELSLDDECLSAVGVLRAAGVEVLVDRGPLELSTTVATTLATVLREGVTNVIRHSKASWCQLTVRAAGGTAWLVLVNDGVTEDLEGEARTGCGLRNLTYRVGAHGGELSAAIQPDGTHRLSVRVPLTALRPHRPGRAR
ncbi:sensor histidine kinase [Amycolatopsis samaneae]|uniref:Sensor histidine kinase n=1 Tax=Amycolatopsis samaneae TaxID=664691 RepID=A0ABW5GUI9_9PSEU